MIIGGHEVTISNPEKIFWPKEEIKKIDLIEYYLKVAPYILPYLKDRPQNLNRFPDGIEGQSFYHKDLAGLGPNWLKKIKIKSRGEENQYLLCQNVATLIFMINLGSIEINPWSSRVESLQNPDWAVIDLDPEDISFEEVKKVAFVAHEVLEEIRAIHFLKTSGATGLHIYLPFKNKYSYEQIKNFTFLICNVIHQKIPKITSLERLPKNRQKKVYLDYLQNNKGQTLAAPYSVRPRAGAPVSTPLEWSELKNIEPTDFTISNIFYRLAQKGDIFKGVLTQKNNLEKILNNLEKYFHLDL